MSTFLGASRRLLLCAVVAVMASATVCFSDAIDTTFKLSAAWDGLGEEQRAAVQEAEELLLKKHLLTEADEKLKEIMAAFKNVMSDPNATYVCFR